MSTEPVGFVWVPVTSIVGKNWVTDRDTLFQYLELLNAKHGTNFRWRWSGTGKEPNVEVYDDSFGFNLYVEARMVEIQEAVERMLPIWGLTE